MKTPRKDGRLENLDQNDLATLSRRKRTVTAPACESLEGRKLMTGVGGAAAAMMGTSPAAMADMGTNGSQRAGLNRFNQGTSTDTQGVGGQNSRNQGGYTQGASTNTQGVGGQNSWNQGGSMLGGTGSLLRGMASGGSAQSDLKAERFGGSGASGFGGQGLGGDPRFGSFGSDRGTGGASNVPMSGQTGSGDPTGAAGTNSQLKTDFEKLMSDEQAIHDKSQVTPALEASVRKDLEAIDKAKTGTADATALKTLQTDEQTIFSTQTGQTTPTAPTDAQRTQLQADQDAVLKSQGVSQTLIGQLATDRLAVKTASNFTADDQATLDADHKAVDADRAALTSTSTNGGNSNLSTSSTSSPTTTPPGSSSNATPAVAASSTANLPSTQSNPPMAAPDSAQAAPPATTNQASAPVAPSASAQTSAVATSATPTLDPRMTQTTSSAAPMTSTTMGTTMNPTHHGRANLGHQGGFGHQIQHSSNLVGHSRRAPRN